MSANVEKQQGHRPGIYKQKNKVHKHGKHRTKGEIERENKGKMGSVMKFCLTAGVILVTVVSDLPTHVFRFVEDLGVSSVQWKI